MTDGAPKPVLPRPMAENFVNAFAAFVDAVRAELKTAALDPLKSSSGGVLIWQTQALPRLEETNAAIQNGFALFLIGEEMTLAKMAKEQLGLAKRLDGYSLDFNGPEAGKQLDKLETAAVVTAYQLCSMAGLR